jgi:hypothetical protein
MPHAFSVDPCNRTATNPRELRTNQPASARPGLPLGAIKTLPTGRVVTSTRAPERRGPPDAGGVSSCRLLARGNRCVSQAGEADAGRRLTGQSLPAELA